jgi:hypothetical protein
MASAEIPLSSTGKCSAVLVFRDDDDGREVRRRHLVANSSAVLPAVSFGAVAWVEVGEVQARWMSREEIDRWQSGESGNGRMVSVKPFGVQARDWYLPGRETGCGVLTKPFRRGVSRSTSTSV